ncbi:MAG: peptidoglycan-associated lipoprotein Pal [Chromatiales bacterium]|jgi:peptidoglycan-associated lipoprotein
MKLSLMKWSVALFAVLLFTGCSSMMKSDEAGSEGAPVSESEGASTAGATRGGAWTGNPLDNPDSPLYTKVVYFDFDKSAIRSEFVDTLRAHAEYLLSNSSATLTIQGHCDERGSREYNIGLGERRADAIKSFLEAEGVSASQISTISYGEERPAAMGHDEAAWALNRRGVLDY